MFSRLLLLFVALFITEIYLLITVGAEIGAGSTVLWIIASAFFGIFFMKQQSLSLMVKIKQSTAQNKMPIGEMFENMVLPVAVILLVLPGFITDTIGAILLIPPLRQRLVFLFTKKVAVKSTMQGFHPENTADNHDGHTVEGEFYEENEKKKVTTQPNNK